MFVSVVVYFGFNRLRKNTRIGNNLYNLYFFYFCKHGLSFRKKRMAERKTKKTSCCRNCFNKYEKKIELFFERILY